MNKRFLTFTILLLVSMVSMVGVSPVGGANPTDLSVDPASIIDDTMQPKPVETIRPMADGTFTDWTHKTLTVRPNGDGTCTDWTGRILTLGPNDHGTYTDWSSWIHIRPDENGNYTGWVGAFSFWDDWPNHDSDTTYCRTTMNNTIETSTFENPPTEPRALNISKVRLTMVARYYGGSNEQVQMMLSGLLDANVTGRLPDAAWNGWTRIGTSPWLDAPDYPANLIYTSVTDDKIGNFTFQDVPTGQTWNTVLLRIKTWKSGGDDRMNITLYDGASWKNYTVSPTSTETYVNIDVSGFLNTEAKINAAQMRIEKITLGDVDTIYVDHVCLLLSGLRYGGTTFSLTPTYASYMSEWSTHPATGSAWTWSDIDNLHAGVRSVQVGTWEGQLRVTQLYVSVLTGGLYTDLDEWPDDNGDTDCVIATDTTLRQSSALEDHTAEAWSIARVQVSIVARTTTSEKVTIILVIGGTIYTGDECTLTTTYATYSSVWTQNPAGGAWAWSDIDALEAGVKTRDKGPAWSGEVRVTQLYVKVIEPGTYAHWDETTQDGDGTYNSAISDAQNQSSTLEDHTAEAWSIARVQVSIVARTEFSDEEVTIILVIGGTIYEGSTHSLSNDAYKTYSSVWTQNPATISSWTWSDIDALQAGVKSKQVDEWKGEIRVTQLYVEVGEAGTYAEWDEAVQNGDADYVSATMLGMVESSPLENPVHQPWAIGRVRVVFYARATVTTDEQVEPVLVVGGFAWPGTSYTLTTTYVEYTGDWGKNPYTDDYWTWSEIDALEAGVQSRVGDDGVWEGEIRVTQLCVEVAARATSMVYVQVANVTDLYGYEFLLNYTTDTLSVASISLGGWFPPDSVIWQQEINDDLGYLRYGVTMPFGSLEGKTGNGILANITFLVDSYGESSLDLCNTKLVDSLGEVIPHEINDGYFNNMIFGDVNRDQTVNTSDLSDFSEVYGSKPSNWNQGDFNRDNKTDAYDLFHLGKNFEKSI